MIEPPTWSRTVVALPGAAALSFGALSVIAPHLPFGKDAHRVPVRVATGTLGAAATGLGVAALDAAATGDAAALRSATVGLLATATSLPPVVLYDIGYFDTVASAGRRALSLALGIALGVGVPLVLSLRVLDRLVRAS